MEMWLKQSTLVFLTVAVAAMGISGQAPVILDEKQRRVEVRFGTAVLNLNCSLSTAGYERFRVAWYFNRSGSSHNIYEKIFNRSANTSNMVSNTEETLVNYTLPIATEEASGWYFCKVTAEIPAFASNTSNGTEVVITTVSPTDDFPLIEWWLWITLGVSAFILIVLLAICVLLRRRCRRSRAEDPVYANTRPKQPSPRPGIPVENLKSVSSSQNLRNPSPGSRYDERKRRYKQ